MRTRLSRSDRHVATSPELITAIKNLYIVSSAAAQLGGHGLEVREAQWRALAQKTEMARVVLDQQATTRDTDGIAAFHCLAKMCEDVVVLYAMRRPFPTTLWREVGRLGREALRMHRSVRPPSTSSRCWNLPPSSDRSSAGHMMQALLSPRAPGDIMFFGTFVPHSEDR